MLKKISIIEKFIIVIFTLISLVLILVEVPNLNYIISIIILLCILFLRYNDAIFFVFLITTLGWGASININYRMGNILFSDLSLLLLFFNILYGNLTKKIKSSKILLTKSNVFLIGIIIIFILFGIVKGYAFYNILQDLKLFLYIYLPFLYLSSPKKNDRTIFYYKPFLQICLVLICIQQIVHFSNVGLENLLSSGFGMRDVGINMQVIAMGAPILICFRKNNLWDNISFWLLQGLCFFSIIISFTRSIWISYILGMVLVLFLINENNGHMLKKLSKVMSLLLLLYFIVFLFFPYERNEIQQAIEFRVFNNRVDTLADRLSDSNQNLETKILRLQTIIGDGFGEISEESTSVFIENSVYYYMWKYGILISLTCFFSIAKNIYVSYKNKNFIIKASSITLSIFLIVGNFSGNLNLYYLAPILSLILSYNKIYKNYDFSIKLNR